MASRSSFCRNRVLLAGSIGCCVATVPLTAIGQDGPGALATETGPVVPLVLFLAVIGAALLAGGALALAWWRAMRRRDLVLASLNATGRARQLVDARGRVLLANLAFERLFGRRDEPLPRLLESRLAPESDAAEILRQLKRSVVEGGRGRSEIEIAGSDGNSDWYDVSARAIAEFPGHILWGAELVTAQRQIEEFIRSDHEKFADLIEHAPIGFYSVDEAGRFLFVNSTLASWLGFLPSDDGGYRQCLHDLVAEPLPPGHPPHSPFRDPKASSGEVVLCGPNGRSFQAFVRHDVATMQSAPSGQPRLRTRSVVHDLSRERELESAVQVSEQYFQRFFEEAPASIVMLDSAGRIEQANPAFQQLIIGAEWAQARFVDLVQPEERALAEAHLTQVMEKGRAGQPLTVRLVGDTPRSVTIYASRREDKGRAIGQILHLIDATEQKRLEAQFAQSQKMQAVGLLAGGIAHDFNNLLTAMIGFCDLLLLRHKAGDQSFADIMQIKQNANRAANLVRQLLAFSRQQTLQPRVLDVTDVLAELSHLIRRLIGENIELAMEHGRDLASVRADAGQLEQVIINLAVNARDAMPDGGRLLIRTRNTTTTEPISRGVEVMPPGTYVLIEMADTGSGIPPEILDRIFEPFFSTKAVGSGTGLGLSTVYGIVRQTGGFVFVDSQLGRGTTFRIYLPQHAANGAATTRLDHAEDQPRDLTGIGTVLLVEDEDAVRLFSARALRNKGYKVLEARSGEAALEIMNEQVDGIDLIISDVVMPNMDGPTLIKLVRQRRPDLKVIFISGYAEDDFRRKIDAGEEAHFLMKPFTLKQLAAKVKDVLE
ncbi:two-component system cell cycle sensor histidine kinase/response regulator CckA [Dongia mobilis]|uniref:histidine kinase n=1 Tax=Dongia mobilis TaxID=578943 RepID=A0A4R6WWI2_9PROT|nr:response regulator [Dongia mobilis]TDQ84404.1 two-component system cell cycle sensor histidine kinase/response regulator CckA [Dongia mobilis]